jgi:uncharacterized protein
MLEGGRGWRPTKAGFAALLLCMAILAGNYLPTPAVSGNYLQVPSSPSRAPLRTIPSDHMGADQSIDARMQYDVDGAVDVVNQYWADHWTDDFLGEYEPPTIAGGYEDASVPSCYGEPLEPMNAFYCPEGDYIAWDRDFFRTHYANDGNELFAYVLIAHEMGHVVQQRLGPLYATNAPELQADCLAGLALYGAERDGTLRLQNGAGNEMGATFALIGDDTPWAATTGHGDAVDRMAAFAAGRSGNITACVPLYAQGSKAPLNRRP